MAKRIDQWPIATRQRKRDEWMERAYRDVQVATGNDEAPFVKGSETEAVLDELEADFCRFLHISPNPADDPHE